MKTRVAEEQVLQMALRVWRMRETKFVFSTLMIFVCYLVFAGLQERLANKEWGSEREVFSFTLYMLFLQSIANCIMAFVLVKVQRIPPSTVPAKNCLMIALFYILAMFFSNAALAYISFPVQTLLKSCKPIPVMIVGSMILGKRYSLSQFLCVVLMSIGIFVFVLSTPPVVPIAPRPSPVAIAHTLSDQSSLGDTTSSARKLHQIAQRIDSGTSIEILRQVDSLLMEEAEDLEANILQQQHQRQQQQDLHGKGQKTRQKGKGEEEDQIDTSFKEPLWLWWWGIVMVLFSLAMDGLTGPFQERQIKQYRPLHASQLMFLSNLWSIVVVCVGMIFTGEYIPATMMIVRFPSIAFDLIWWSLCSALGQHFIYYHLFHFGALSLSIVTTIRKFATILGSIILFGHSVSGVQWLGVALVFWGLGMEIYLSHSQHQSAKTTLPLHQPLPSSRSPSLSGNGDGDEREEVAMTIGVSSAMLSIVDRPTRDEGSFV